MVICPIQKLLMSLTTIDEIILFRVKRENLSLGSVRFIIMQTSRKGELNGIIREN